MDQRLIFGLGLMWAAFAPLHAQQAKAAEPKADAAEATAAMERVRKMADSPMRAIQEASKLRRKVGAGEGEALAAGAVKPLPAGTPAPSAKAKPQPKPATALVPELSPSLAARTRLAEPAEARSAPVASAGLGTADVTAAPPVVPVTQIAEIEAQPVPALVLPPSKPKLREKVEPDIPSRVLYEVGQMDPVQADLLIRTDGSVAQVTLVPPVPRQVARFLVSALERWRFEPLAAPAQHRVVLVFKDEH